MCAIDDRVDCKDDPSSLKAKGYSVCSWPGLAWVLVVCVSRKIVVVRINWSPPRRDDVLKSGERILKSSWLGLQRGEPAA